MSDDEAKYSVIAPDGGVFARYGSYDDALKGARWLLADDPKGEARIEWSESGHRQSRSVSHKGGHFAAPFRRLTRARSPAEAALSGATFRPAMTGAVVVAAVGLLAWALIAVVKIIAQ
jgi:hypothetical protein